MLAAISKRGSGTDDDDDNDDDDDDDGDGDDDDDDEWIMFQLCTDAKSFCYW